MRKTLSGAKPTEKQLNASMYSKIYKHIMMEKNLRIREAKDQATGEEESAQRARLISAGGKYAYQWLQIPQKAAKLGLGVTLTSRAGHLFEVAFRLRMELTMRQDLQGGKCRCNVQGSFMRRAARDHHCRHLASGCTWGNWRKKRHDDAVKVIVEWIKASGNRAHEDTVGAYPPRGVARTDDTGKTETHRVSCNTGQSINCHKRATNDI